MYAFNIDAKSHSPVTSHLPQTESQSQCTHGPLGLSLLPPTSLLFLRPLLVLHLRAAHWSPLCLEALPHIYTPHCHPFPAPAPMLGLPSMTILPKKYPHQSLYHFPAPYVSPLDTVHCLSQLEDRDIVSFTALSLVARRVRPLVEWMDGHLQRPDSPGSGAWGRACDMRRERNDWLRQ